MNLTHTLVEGLKILRSIDSSSSLRGVMRRNNKVEGALLILQGENAQKVIDYLDVLEAPTFKHSMHFKVDRKKHKLVLVSQRTTETRKRTSRSEVRKKR